MLHQGLAPAKLGRTILGSGLAMFAAFRHLLGLIKNRGIFFDIFSGKSQVDYKVLRDGVPIGYEVSQGNINIVNIHLEQAPGLGQSSLV